MTPDDVREYFSQSDGSYLFARWGRPIVPVLFGVDDDTLAVFKYRLEEIVNLAGHEISDTDPELGANLMVFFLSDWSELAAVKDMDQLVPELPELLVRLQAGNANQYRLFRFDEAGAIRACFVFLRLDQAMANVAAEDIALGQFVQVMLLWGPGAFAGHSLLVQRATADTPVVRDEIAGLIRAAYDPVLPDTALDASHSLRLYARLQAEI